MKVNVAVKQIGKKKKNLAAVPFEYEKTPHNAKEIIEETVKICVNEYNKRFNEDEEVKTILSEKEILDKSEVGKIAFGVIYGEKKADYNTALDTALLAFKDGLIRIFIDENEIEALEQEITIKENSTLVFIRLTFLAGRMW